MEVNLKWKAFDHAKSLVREGEVVRHSRYDWSEALGDLLKRIGEA